MIRSIALVRGATGALLAGSLLAAAPALAQDAGTMPNCNDTTKFPNPIFMAGSSAFEPTLKVIATKLAVAATPVSVIYKSTASCDGPNNVANNLDLTGSASYYTLDTTVTPAVIVTNSCLLPASGQKADVGISDIFFESCPGLGAKPATVGDFFGTAQAMLFVVPEANTSSTSVTFAEAQDIWGCGAAGNVSPFLEDNGIMQRNPTSGTQGTVAASISVPATAFHGVTNASGGNLVTSLTGYSNPQAAIGFVAADLYDANRSKMNALAFRAFGQNLAFYADSTPDVADRRNARDGHYVVWGFEHFFTLVDSTGKPTKPLAESIIGWINGTTSTPAFDYVAVESSAGTIPLCAMKVTRSQDGGYLSPYTPADPCNCAFEAAATKSSPANCPVCTTNTDCTGAGKACHHGYCE